jgi:hypothetical protein
MGFADACEMLVKAKLVLQIASILRERDWGLQVSEAAMGMLPTSFYGKVFLGEYA